MRDINRPTTFTDISRFCRTRKSPCTNTSRIFPLLYSHRSRNHMNIFNYTTLQITYSNGYGDVINFTITMLPSFNSWIIESKIPQHAIFFKNRNEGNVFFLLHICRNRQVRDGMTIAIKYSRKAIGAHRREILSRHIDIICKRYDIRTCAGRMNLRPNQIIH